MLSSTAIKEEVQRQKAALGITHIKGFFAFFDHKKSVGFPGHEDEVACGGEGIVLMMKDKHPDLVFKSYHPAHGKYALALLALHRCIDVMREAMPQEFQIQIDERKLQLEFTQWLAVDYPEETRESKHWTQIKETPTIVMCRLSDISDPFPLSSFYSHITCPETRERLVKAGGSHYPKKALDFLKEKGIVADPKWENYQLKGDSLYCLEPEHFEPQSIDLIESIPDKELRQKAQQFWVQWWTERYPAEEDSKCPRKIMTDVHHERCRQVRRQQHTEPAILVLQ